MIDKIIDIFGSVRFLQVVIAFMVTYLGSIGWVSPDLAQAIASILGVSVAIGTIDKVGQVDEK